MRVDDCAIACPYEARKGLKSIRVSWSGYARAGGGILEGPWERVGGP